MRWDKYGRTYLSSSVAEFHYLDRPEGRYTIQRAKFSKKWNYRTPTKGAGTLDSFDACSAHCKTIMDELANERQSAVLG